MAKEVSYISPSFAYLGREKLGTGMHSSGILL